MISQNLFLAFASRFSFLAFNYFIAVRNAVTVVRFGNSDFADVSGGLSDQNFVDAGNDDFVRAGAFELNARGFGEVNGVRKTYVEYDLVALLCNLPADAVYFKGFGTGISR